MSFKNQTVQHIFTEFKSAEALIMEKTMNVSHPVSHIKLETGVLYPTVAGAQTSTARAWGLYSNINGGGEIILTGFATVENPSWSTVEFFYREPKYIHGQFQFEFRNPDNSDFTSAVNNASVVVKITLTE